MLIEVHLTHTRDLLLLTCWGLCAVLAGCAKSEENTGRGDAAGDMDQAGIDALRALPYAGSTTVNADEVDGVIFRDEQRSCAGYSLYGVQMLSMAELIDEQGKVINSWSHSPSQRWEGSELLPNGDLLVVGAEHSQSPAGRAHQVITDDARYVLRLSWDGRLLWKRKLRAHHDIEVTPHGKLLVLTFQRRLLPRIHAEVEVRDDQLTLLEQDGTTIESHSLLEAVTASAGVFHLRKVAPSSLGEPPWVDLFHSNSVEWMHHQDLVKKHPLYDLDNILVCFRHQERVAIFNWSQDRVVWAWGQGEIKGPHDAQVLTSGNILLFDNGLGRGYSRALELDPVAEKIVWEYKADPPTDFYTASKGSVQRLPNGNTLLAESDKGRAIEVTPEGEVVWEFICPHQTAPGERAAITRIKRFPREFIEPLIKEHGEQD